MAIKEKMQRKEKMTKFSYPFKKKYPISSPFGKRTDPFDNNKQEFHTGIDFACPENTEVLAPCGGYVIKIWEDNFNGKALRIQSEDNEWVIGFGHLNSNTVTLIGEPVVAGEGIALSGNTGHSKNPHCHITFWRVVLDAKNPEEYLPKDETK